MFAVESIGRYLSRGVGTVSGPFHPFGGAVDIVVVEQPDGSFKSSPWYVTFGKFQGVLKAREKVVDICVNGVEADFPMYLDHRGQAYFLMEVVGEEGQSGGFPSSGDETDGQSENKGRPMKSKSSNIDASKWNLDDQNNVKMGRTVSRTNSRRARMFGLVFGRSSIKEDNCQEGEGGAVVRISSLERAEIAADLLEVEWSTNLATSMSRKDNTSRYTYSNALDGKSDKDIPTSEEQSQVGSPVRDTVRNTVDHFEMDEEIDIRKQETCSISHSSYENLEHLVGQASAEMQCLRPDIEASMARGVLEGAYEVLPEMSRRIDESSMGNADNDENLKCDVSEMSVPDSEIPLVLKAYAAKQFNEDQACGERNVVLSGCRIFEEERKSEKVLYFETSGSSSVELHGVGEQMQMQETVHFSCGDHGEVHVCAETLHVATELLAEETTTEGTEDIEFEVDRQNVSELSSQQERTYPFCLYDSNKVNLEVPLSLSESNTEICSHEPVCDSAEGANSHGFSNLDHPFHVEKPNMDETSTNLLDQTSLKAFDDSQTCHGNCVQRRALNIPPSDNLEEEQFLFSDLDELKLGEVQPTELIILDDVDKENDPSFCLQGIMEMDDSVNIDESHSSPNKFVEHTSIDLEKSTPNPRVTSSSVNIPGTHVGTGKEVARLAESLPNMWSQIGNLGPEELHPPLSYSLDSNSESLKSTMHSSYIDADVGKENQLPKEDSDTKANDSGDFKHSVFDSTIGDPLKEFAPNGSWKIWPFSYKKSKSCETLLPSLNDARNSDADNLSESTTGAEKVIKKKVKAKTPSSEQLASLNLKEGSNSVTFTFSTPMLGRQQVDARIYLWKWNTRIVISDVDGTITRSDVLGQFMPFVGVDWSQTGVTHLFSAIKENGYQLLFLSARAISQAYLTRRFLVNLIQNGKALPDGPVVISPDGLFPSLFREVIRRAPHEFKIACLEDIKALFPPDCNPFYAGFGNRDTDEISYLKVGIPMGKIFIINPKGEVAVHRRVDTKSYSSLHALVNDMFPPMASSGREFTQVVYGGG
ncbi:phosphatidate phosphatase PAH2-like isoform X1 [Tripterygium wilfordii]|uniref:Phosphatidate phosphatase PAH2-like isoform X1 n=1 Tax=Tripterygium wilfordii TaxID=458696 RepID=A0A7J7DKZ8_TRIWF|nr:phosphatidate phosphatase PAH2-like isoform X1 [Tripterygium wilfordii]